MLTVGFSNDKGTRTVDRLPANVRVPDNILLHTFADNRQDSTPTLLDINPYPTVKLGDHLGANVWEQTVGPIARLEHDVRYLLLDGRATWRSST